MGDGALRLGPLLLPHVLLLVMASVAATLAIGRWLGRRRGVDAEAALWRALLVGLLVARLGFVYEYRALYLASPLTILDIRDGGWNAGLGLVGAWLYALVRQRRERALAQPLRWALLAGTVLFIGGSVLLALRGAEGEQLPAELDFVQLDGEVVALGRFVGRPVVINLWATWCPPCVREMPVLQQAQARRTDVHFVFLNQGEDAATVQRWLQARQLALKNVLVDERREASARFRQQGYPTTLFFDAQGRLVGRRIGELSAATLEQQLQKATAGP